MSQLTLSHKLGGRFIFPPHRPHAFPAPSSNVCQAIRCRRRSLARSLPRFGAHVPTVCLHTSD